MYNSGMTAAELVAAVKNEADISVTIPDSVWFRAINTVEQFLYTEILREYAAEKLNAADIEADTIRVSGIVPMQSGADTPNYDDVIKVFADDIEIERSGVIGATEFPEKDLYYTDYDGNLVLNLADYADEITVIYRLRPILKAEGSSDIVAVPPEFLDLVAAKMRGEAYKIANEDGLAAKWLADYNAQLESFKVWAAGRNQRYGG